MYGDLGFDFGRGGTAPAPVMRKPIKSRSIATFVLSSNTYNPPPAPITRQKGRSPPLTDSTTATNSATSPHFVFECPPRSSPSSPQDDAMGCDDSLLSSSQALVMPLVEQLLSLGHKDLRGNRPPPVPETTLNNGITTITKNRLQSAKLSKKTKADKKKKKRNQSASAAGRRKRVEEEEEWLRVNETRPAQFNDLSPHQSWVPLRRYASEYHLSTTRPQAELQARPPSRQKDAFPVHLADLEDLLPKRKDAFQLEVCEATQQHIQTTRKTASENPRPPSRHKPPSTALFLDAPPTTPQSPVAHRAGRKPLTVDNRNDDPERDGFTVLSPSAHCPFKIKVTNYLDSEDEQPSTANTTKPEVPETDDTSTQPTPQTAPFESSVYAHLTVDTSPQQQQRRRSLSGQGGSTTTKPTSTSTRSSSIPETSPLSATPSGPQAPSPRLIFSRRSRASPSSSTLLSPCAPDLPTSPEWALLSWEEDSNHPALVAEAADARLSHQIVFQGAEMGLDLAVCEEKDLGNSKLGQDFLSLFAQGNEGILA